MDPTKLKQFWKGIKVLNRGASVIPPLSHEGVTADSSLGKANMLNNYFATQLLWLVLYWLDSNYLSLNLQKCKSNYFENYNCMDKLTRCKVSMYK